MSGTFAYSKTLAGNSVDFKVRSKEPLTGCPYALAGSYHINTGGTINLWADLGTGFVDLGALTADEITPLPNIYAKQFRLAGTGVIAIVAGVMIEEIE